MFTRAAKPRRKMLDPQLQALVAQEFLTAKRKQLPSGVSENVVDPKWLSARFERPPNLNGGDAFQRCFGRSGYAEKTMRLIFTLLLILPSGVSAQAQGYAGSTACKTCHPALYSRWSKTRMANVVRDPKVHPEAVLGDFAHPDPNRPSGLDQVAFVYGSRL